MRSDRNKRKRKQGKTAYLIIMVILFACIIIPVGIMGGIWLAGSKGLSDYKADYYANEGANELDEENALSGDSQNGDTSSNENKEEEQKEKTYKRAVGASSTLPDDGGVNYRDRNLYDGNLLTAWSEGVSGIGIDEWIQISFDAPIPEAIKIYNGYQKTENLYYSNGRVCDAVIEFSNGKTYAVTLAEDYGAGQVVYFPDLGETNSFRLTIKSVYEGSQWDDTTITEIELFNPEEQDMYSEILIYAVEY